ncbi:MAG TPA: hypothetical protein VHS09_03505 [Polyangiaceae bacterium]|jgi:hypothetical protein|nr:hypothetical protein [Polyangiaceae bacterium]
MKKTTASLLVVCGLAATGAVPTLYGCGGGAKPAATAGEPSGDTSSLPEPAVLATSSAAPADSSTAPANDTSPLAQVLTTDAGQIQKIFQQAAAAPAATLKQNGATGGDPLAAGIRDAAKKLPAGMQPDGPLAMGSIKEKQHLQTDVTLAPGKCYSIVGYSKKVKDLDLYLLLPPGALSGQDLTDDNKPIIGGPPQPMCPVSPTAVTYKLDIFADSGSGDVAVQLFSKGK